MNIHIAEFLISSYDAPLAQRASYLALHSSLFGPDGAVNYDYIITNSINIDTCVVWEYAVYIKLSMYQQL